MDTTTSDFGTELARQNIHYRTNGGKLYNGASVVSTKDYYVQGKAGSSTILTLATSGTTGNYVLRNSDSRYADAWYDFTASPRAAVTSISDDYKNYDLIAYFENPLEWEIYDLKDIDATNRITITKDTDNNFTVTFDAAYYSTGTTQLADAPTTTRNKKFSKFRVHYYTVGTGNEEDTAWEPLTYGGVLGTNVGTITVAAGDILDGTVIIRVEAYDEDSKRAFDYQKEYTVSR